MVFVCRDGDGENKVKALIEHAATSPQASL